jgi:CRP/FNR family transcriptional regulator, anaerobic regulatory protein
MSREDVGRYLGLALETISRGFTKLQDEGVIEVAGRTVKILDVEQLRRIAQLPDTNHEPPLQRQA